MGAVYEAVRPDGSRCALKVVLGNLGEGARRERFLREAAVGRELRHPGIVQIESRGEVGELAYLVMELIEDGRTLDDYAKKNALGVGSRIGLILQVAQALEAAHAVELIHRDLKPDNVLVTPDGQVKVLPRSTVVEPFRGIQRTDLCSEGLPYPLTTSEKSDHWGVRAFFELYRE